MVRRVNFTLVVGQFIRGNPKLATQFSGWTFIAVSVIARRTDYVCAFLDILRPSLAFEFFDACKFWRAMTKKAATTERLGERNRQRRLASKQCKWAYINSAGFTP